MFKLFFHKRARKSYDKISEKTAKKFNEAIENLKINPFAGKDVKKLRGKLTGKY